MKWSISKSVNERYVARLRGATAARLEHAVEGIDRRPGTKRPHPLVPNRGALP